MNKLKQIRQERNLSQPDLAEMIGATQQTIRLWETGKTTIPPSALKDLAIVLSCSVDEILGLTPKGYSCYPRFLALPLDKKKTREIVCYYGGLTLHLKGVKDELDYPVDEEVADSLGWYLQNPTDQPLHPFPWMWLETMNNYILFVNLKALKIAYLYSDTKQKAPSFYHPEVYRVLTNWDKLENENPTIEEIASVFEISEKLAKFTQSVVKTIKGEDEYWNAWEEFEEIKIYWLDGTQTSHYLDKKLYSDLEDLKHIVDVDFFDLYPEAHLGARFIQEDDDGLSTTFLNLEQIALMQVPAIKFWQVACECDPNTLEMRGTSAYLPWKNCDCNSTD